MASRMSVPRLVAITGCDSGLGWALAARAAREGMVTVAGMYQGPNTPAAKALQQLKAHTCQLDMRSPNSVDSFKDYVMKVLKENRDCRLYAVVNNAGVMTIGDMEWNRLDLMEDMINVNLIGTMRVIKNFLPDLRRTAKEGTIKPRIINIASHCGVAPLPGFAAYGASKAGVLFMTESLRMEQRPYGVSAVALVPGGFFSKSNILIDQSKKYAEMLSQLDEEQKKVYGPNLSLLVQYIKGQEPGVVPFDAMNDIKILDKFAEALTTEYPKAEYVVEPWRYKMYYKLFSMKIPERIKYWLKEKFLSFPNG